MNKILKLLLAVLLVGCGGGAGYKSVSQTEATAKPVIVQTTKNGMTGVEFSPEAFSGFPVATTIDATFDRQLFQNMPKDIVLAMNVGQHCLDDLFLFAPVQLQTVVVRLKNAPVCFQVLEGKVAVLNIEVEPVTTTTTPTGKGSVSVTISCPLCCFGCPVTGTTPPPVTNPVTTATNKKFLDVVIPWSNRFGNASTQAVSSPVTTADKFLVAKVVGPDGTSYLKNGVPYYYSNWEWSTSFPIGAVTVGQLVTFNVKASTDKYCLLEVGLFDRNGVNLLENGIGNKSFWQVNSPGLNISKAWTTLSANGTVTVANADARWEVQYGACGLNNVYFSH